MSGPVSGRIDCRKLRLDPMETAARLHSSVGYFDSLTDSCLEELMRSADCRFAWIRVPVIRDHGCLDLGFGPFVSRDLEQSLTGCREAFVFALCLGIGVDRLLIKESLMSEARHFVTDALASSLAESACNEAERQIKGTLSCRPRFSPGYGDLPLELQPAVLKLLSAERLLGISLGSSLLMTPSKSITAIMGIKNEKV